MNKKLLFPYLVIILFSTLLGPGAGFAGNDLSTNGTNAFLPLIMNQFDEAQVTGPSITTHPAAKTVNADQTASFSIVASGTAPLRYQWQRSNNTGTSWSTVGTNSASYSFTAAPGDNGAWFRCTVSNPGGSATSNHAILTVAVVFPTCYTLTLNHTGSGTDPTATPVKSAACAANGQYVAGESIALSGAVPAANYQIVSWTGTANDSSTLATNSLIMPAAGLTVSVNYTAIPPTCYALTLSHTGQGSDPVATPVKSAACAANGQYVAGESIALSGAVPAANYQIGSWTGTSNNSSTAATNTLTMPAAVHSASVVYVQQPPTLICETFNAFTPGSAIGTYAGWFDGGSGPVVTNANGVAGSTGLAPATNIFTWTAHPFNWNAADFQSVTVQADFKTDAGGYFDDDRIGWMTTSTSVDSTNFFGVQLDNVSGGDGGIVTYWRNAAGDRVQTPIVPLGALTGSTWYRFSAQITKLTATSARIDVNLVQLDAVGNPTGTPITGTVSDTSAWAGGTPPARYFTPTSMWPAYKNFNVSPGAAPADNTCYQFGGGTLPSTITVTFRNGLNSYTGTVDTQIMQDEPAASHGALAYAGWDTENVNGNAATQKFALIRFDNIFGAGANQVPPGAAIQSATLRYVVYDTGGQANVNEVAVDWATDVTWNTFGAAAGVQAGDYGASRGTAAGTTVGEKTLDVTASLIAWVSNPTANRGWIFRPTTNDGIDFRSSEYATAADRPSLTVQYTTN
jgi:hypothetical protein